LQDDGNPDTRLLINTATGVYRFFCGSDVFSGTGDIIRVGCTIVLRDTVSGRTLVASVAARTGAAVLRNAGGSVCLIVDRDLRDNDCVGD
jgi:hypothetical protein